MVRGKLYHLRRIWKESNFQVMNLEIYEEDGEILEVELYLKNINGQSRKFNENWNDIKRAADRQNFYVLPIVEMNIHGNIGVCLINKESIFQIYKKFHSFIDLNNSSYWALQGNKEYVDCNSGANALAEDAYLIQKYARVMRSNSSHSYIFEDRTYYKLWKEYKESVRHWVAETLRLDHSAKIESITTYIFHLYVYED